MNRFTKWMLGLAAVCVVVGMGMIIAGLSLGAGISDAAFITELGRRVLRIKDFSRVEAVIQGEEELSDVLENRKLAEEEEGYEAYEGELVPEHASHNKKEIYYALPSVKNLEIDLKAGELVMDPYSGDEILVRVDHEDQDTISVSSGEDFLKIETKEPRIHGGEVRVSYPEQLKLEQLKIALDAGEIEIHDDIHAELLDVSIAAGELKADGKLYADSAILEVGAGEVDIGWIAADVLEGNCGLGEMELCLAGREEDYHFELQCGLGVIQIGENSHSSIAGREEIDHGHEEKNILLSCGLGEIEISFEK